MLKKLISILRGVAPSIPVIGGILSAIIPGTKDDKIIQTVQSDFGEVMNAITQAEYFGDAWGKPGAEKLQAVAPLVAKIFLSSAALANHKVKDPDLFQRGATKAADGFADMYNALDENGVSTESKKA